MLDTPRRSFGNIVGHAKGVGDLSSLSSWTAEQFDPALSWDDVKWIKDLWGGKLILKGILDPEDAEMAAKSGADALIVSNHGGRQLDGALSSIAALPAIVEQVGGRMEILFDGGIRSGQDVIKALALGAHGTFIGPEPALLVFLVVLEVALEPFDMAVALEGEDVGRDTVEEPAIMADDHGAAGEVLQRLFQRPQRVDVEIVGRLVEQQDVGAGLQHLGEMHAVALAARERADLLLLVAALEVEGRAIGARIDFRLPRGSCRCRPRFPPRRSSCRRASRATGRHSRACTLSPILIVPESGFSWPVIILNSVVLPAPLAPMTPTMPPGGSLKVRSSISSLPWKPFDRSFEIDDVVAEALGDRNDDLRAVVGPLVVGLLAAARHSAGCAPCSWPGGPWATADPFLLALQRLLMRAASSRPSWARRFCFCTSQDE
jgi:hypothetical protein